MQRIATSKASGTEWGALIVVADALEMTTPIDQHG
jgi:hypothetical protein